MHQAPRLDKRQQLILRHMERARNYWSTVLSN
jgi:hypothetical protein